MADIVMLPIERLYSHPDNPRIDVGDVTELAESIKANGILQNLTVIRGHYMTEPEYVTMAKAEGMKEADAKPLYDPHGWLEPDGYTVIIGHRRLAAAKLAGISSVPCSITEMTLAEQVSTMLAENMQRADLTVYEQAHGFQMMLDLGNSMDEIAEISGFSKTTVKRRLKMMELDQPTLKKVSDERQLSLADFDKLSQIEDIAERNKALEKIGTNDFNMAVDRAMKNQAIKRLTPPLKKLLKSAGAKVLKGNERWSSKYERIGSTVYYWCDWDGEADILPKIKGDLFYVLDDSYGDIEFYKAAKKKAREKKSPEEVEKQKKLSAAWEEEKELVETTRRLRADFVDTLSLNGKNVPQMFSAALASLVYRSINYDGSDRDTILGVLGMDECGYDSSKRYATAKAALADINSADVPKIIYANFGDDGNLKYDTGYSHCEFPKYTPNAKLDDLYDWLCSLGYKISEVEVQLMLGTHPLFSRGE